MLQRQLVRHMTQKKLLAEQQRERAATLLQANARGRGVRQNEASQENARVAWIQ